MVYIGIPQNYTTSPSSFVGTPSLTINHEATVDLDSTNAFEGSCCFPVSGVGTRLDPLTREIGPEKLLEVWFAPSSCGLPDSAKPVGLKAVPVEAWKDVLDLVNCKVLSIVQSEDVDAYLLSESSMFVWPHKLILKTCGTTTLLYGLPRILEIAALFAGFPKSPALPSRCNAIAAAPYRVFYSRKNFLFPDRQRGPHRSWRDEVKTMDKLFLNGSAYMIGKMNGEHWYLYLTEPYTMLTPPVSPKLDTWTKVLRLPEEMNLKKRGSGDCEDHDETLEILMTDLDEVNAKQFYLNHASAVAEVRQQNIEQENEDHFDVFSNASSDMSDSGSESGNSLPPEFTTEGHALGTVVAESCGISDIYPPTKYPDSRIDAYLFTPCGFSANGVVPAPDGRSGTHYFTVHVTPESHCSYASFETNVPHLQKGRETADIVKHVVDIFKPGRFTVTLFEAKSGLRRAGDMDGAFLPKMMDRYAAVQAAKMEHINGYRRVDRIVHDLDGYDLVFRYYERNDWMGGVPRIGEHGF
jgi:S-adenosylmethionine decarboxylase